MSTDTNSETQSNEQADVWLTPDQVNAMRDVAIDTGAKYLRQRNEAIIAEQVLFYRSRYDREMSIV